MPSENKTPNLELNQWKGNEYPKRTDFIEDNKKIDEAYKELKDSIKDGGKVSSVNGKIGDVVLKAEDIKTESGDTVQSQMADITKFNRKTYEELKTLKDNNQLQEGKKYLLTDYRTKYQQPTTNVIKEMEVEELILTASSKNTFEPIVFSTKYPSDTIWYDFDNNVCEDNVTARNGFILRRYDPISGNDAPQDWRTMLWARYKPNPTQYYKDGALRSYQIWGSAPATLGVIYKADNKLWMAKNTNTPNSGTDPSVFYEVYPDLDTPLLISEKTKWGDGIELMRGDLVEMPTFDEECKSNVIKDVILPDGAIRLHNNVFFRQCVDNLLSNISYNNTFYRASRNTLGTYCYSNIFNFCSNNLLGGSCSGNILGYLCSQNSFGTSCTGNIFLNYSFENSFDTRCSDNILPNDCIRNSLGVYCYQNKLGSNALDNRFSNYCYNIVFESSCNGNSFNSYCYNISFGRSCSRNSFGNGNNSHVLGSNCYANNFGNSNIIFTLGSRCSYNSFGNDNANNTFGDSCSNNTFFNDCDSNTFGNSFQYNVVKQLKGKNLTDISTQFISASNISTTIEQIGTSKYVFWYAKSDGTGFTLIQIP